MSQKSRLEQVWRQTGRKPPELDIEPLPFELAYLEEVFWDIWNSEGWSWSEYHHYQMITGCELDEGDTLIIRRAFAAGLKFVRDKMKAKHSFKPKGKQDGRK